MTKLFWQVDVTDNESNIWTGPVIYGSHQLAEFHTMLELQSDWGDCYMPDGFIARFGPQDADESEPGFAFETEFPGDEAWDEAGFWDQLDVNVFMLNVDTVTALAKLGRIEADLNEELIDHVMASGRTLSLQLSPL